MCSDNQRQQQTPTSVQQDTGHFTQTHRDGETDHDTTKKTVTRLCGDTDGDTDNGGCSDTGGDNDNGDTTLQRTTTRDQSPALQHGLHGNDLNDRNMTLELYRND